ncbi:MAG: MATE family efflux transporter [Bacteroidales bacterium]|jgi:putative MATE family efflux protein|nr:MATE family efflux transporter [Bacteroidales bacterium]
MLEIVSNKKILNIAYPIILGSIIQNVINVTDTAFLGRVGEIELGASAIGGVFYLTLIMLGLGFSIGTQIIVARRFGERKYQEIGAVIEHALYFLVFLAILLIFGLKLSLNSLFEKIIASNEIREGSIAFLDYRLFGLFFSFINFGFRAFFIGIGRTKIITITTVLMAMINVFFDYSLIFGNFGFPELGLVGAAIASVIAEIAVCLFFFIYVFKIIDVSTFRIFRFVKFDFSILKRVVNVSFPMMMQNFISFFGWFLFFLFVEKMGEHPLAISNIIRSIYVVMLIPIMGFSSATNTLVSFVMGSGQKQQVFPIILKILKMCVTGVFFLVLINLIFPEEVISIYTNNPILIKNSVPALYVISGTSFFIAIGFILFSGVSGTGNTKTSFIIEVIVMIVYVFITYLFANVFKYSIAGVWSVEFIYGGLIALFSIIYLKSGRWKEKIL